MPTESSESKDPTMDTSPTDAEIVEAIAAWMEDIPTVPPSGDYHHYSSASPKSWWMWAQDKQRWVLLKNPLTDANAAMEVATKLMEGDYGIYLSGDRHVWSCKVIGRDDSHVGRSNHTPQRAICLAALAVIQETSDGE